MGDVDDFFNRKQKKKMKNKTKKVVTATDIFNEETEGDNDRENNTNNVRNNLDIEGKDDEWIEASGDQFFVIESVGGIKRLELEEKNIEDGGDRNESDEEKGEISWKQNTDKNAENAGFPGQDMTAKVGLPEAKPEDPRDEENSTTGPSKYVPPSQRQAVKEVKAMPYRRREKIDIESQMDFPTLGAAADSTPEGFEQVQATGKSARAWTSSAMSGTSTGISNRFQSLQNH